jgi:putative protein-disulfide isomerase
MIRLNLPKEVEVKHLLGGLAPDSDLPMPDSMQKEIAGYWRKIQMQIPGTEFNFDFWDKCEPRRSTYPACRAVIAARKQNPDTELEMIEAIQKAYYLNAQNPSEKETLLALAKKLKLDVETFSEDLNSKETQEQLEKEMRFARQIGAQGFPSMIVDKDGQYQYVPLNYNDPQRSLNFVIDL